MRLRIKIPGGGYGVNLKYAKKMRQNYHMQLELAATFLWLPVIAMLIG